MRKEFAVVLTCTFVMLVCITVFYILFRIFPDLVFNMEAIH